MLCVCLVIGLSLLLVIVLHVPMLVHMIIQNVVQDVEIIHNGKSYEHIVCFVFVCVCVLCVCFMCASYVLCMCGLLCLDLTMFAPVLLVIIMFLKPG